ncbi:MAG: hypothetical protein NVS4B6_28640 [Mycobacterium sp.]
MHRRTLEFRSGGYGTPNVLLDPAERTAAGYRTYAADDLAVLRFIRQAKTVGFSLDEIGQIIDLQRRGQQPCATVIDLLDRRLVAVERTLADLRALRQTLIAAKNRAQDAARSGTNTVICRIIESPNS